MELPKDYELNMFMSVDPTLNDGLELDFFSVGELPLGQKRYKILRSLSGEISRAYKIAHVTWYIPSLKENYFVTFPGDIKDKEVTVANYTLTHVETKRLLPLSLSSRNTLARLLYQSARRALSKQGFWKKYYNVYMKDEPLVTSPECEIFTGFYFRIDVFSNGNIGLTIDPTTTIISPSTVLDMIREKGIEEVRKWIRGSPKEPRRRSGVNVFEYRAKRVSRLIGFDPEKKVCHPSFLDPYTNEMTSVIEYQKRRYGISGIDPSEPIALIEYSEDFPPAHHAPSLLKPTLTTEEIPPELQKRYIFLRPHERRKLTLGYRHYLEELRIGEKRVLFNDHMANQRDIPFDNILIPALVFGNAQRVEIRDYKDLKTIKKKSLEMHGPYEKPPMMETCLVYRSDFDRNLIFNFYRDLQKYMKRYYHVNLSNRPREMQTRNYYDLSEKIREHRDKMKVSFFLVVFPSKEAVEYDYIKSELPAPSQGVAIDSIQLKEEIQKTKDSKKKDELRSTYYGIVFFVATGMFIQAGGIPWVLGDKLKAHCHIGIDVGGKEARVACYGYLFDQIGRVIGTEVGTAQSGELVETGRIKRAIIKLLSKIKAKHGTRIIITRDGRLLDEEKQGIKEAVDEYLSQEITKSLDLAVVEIRKNVPFHIYDIINRWVKNPLIGRYALIDENTAVLCTTGYPLITQGVAEPLLIYAYNMYGEFKIREILQDILYLSELNWIAGDKPSKLPVTISLAEDRALFAEKGIKPASKLPV